MTRWKVSGPRMLCLVMFASRYIFFRFLDKFCRFEVKFNQIYIKFDENSSKSGSRILPERRSVSRLWRNILKIKEIFYEASLSTSTWAANTTKMLFWVPLARSAISAQMLTMNMKKKHYSEPAPPPLLRMICPRFLAANRISKNIISNHKTMQPNTNIYICTKYKLFFKHFKFSVSVSLPTSFDICNQQLQILFPRYHSPLSVVIEQLSNKHFFRYRTINFFINIFSSQQLNLSHFQTLQQVQASHI